MDAGRQECNVACATLCPCRYTKGKAVDGGVRVTMAAVLPAGEIGEHPVGIPNNLMPYVHQVRRVLLAI